MHWIEDYPSDHGKNGKFRYELMKLTNEMDSHGRYTEQALQFQGVVTRLAAEDVFYFFNTFLWTYDPRPDHAPADKPFCTFDRQDEYLRWLNRMWETEGNVAGFVDKARDVGFSYVTIGYMVHKWLFKDSFNALIGSRKEDLVEKKGNPDSLMYKADYMLRNMPKWMFPPGFDINNNHRHLIIDRPDNSNTITGESANPDFGRGGRYGMALLDEFGFWQWAKAAWESCGESAHFRLAGTTPPTTGKASHAWKLKTGQAGKVNLFTFDYNSVPWKTAAWLKAAREGKSLEEFEREVMRSYDSSAEGKVYSKEWNTTIKEDKFLEYNPNLPLFVSWDFGYDGTAIIWWQKDFRKNWNYVLESYMDDNKPIGFYLPFVTGLIGTTEFNYSKMEMEMIKRHREWRKADAHFGDPDVAKRDYQLGRSLKDYLAQAPRNIYVQSHKWKDWNHYQIRELTKVLFSRCTINPFRNEQLVDAMLNARYPEPRENSESARTTKLPVHDYTSHLRTAFEYYTINEPEVPPESSSTDHPAGTESDESEHEGNDLSFRSLHS